MQPHPLLSFLGASHLFLEGDSGRSGKLAQEWSGFGSMLSGAFAVLADTEDRADTGGTSSNHAGDGGASPIDAASGTRQLEPSNAEADDLPVGAFGPHVNIPASKIGGASEIESGTAVLNTDSAPPTADAAAVDAETAQHTAGSVSRGSEAAAHESGSAEHGSGATEQGSDLNAGTTPTDKSRIRTAAGEADVDVSIAGVGTPDASGDASTMAAAGTHETEEFLHRTSRSTSTEPSEVSGQAVVMSGDSAQPQKSNQETETDPELRNNPTDHSPSPRSEDETSSLHDDGRRAFASTVRSSPPKRVNADAAALPQAPANTAEAARQAENTTCDGNLPKIDVRIPPTSVNPTGGTDRAIGHENVARSAAAEGANSVVPSDEAADVATSEFVKSNHVRAADLERVARHLTGHRIRTWRESSTPALKYDVGENAPITRTAAETNAVDPRSPDAADSFVRRVSATGETNEFLSGSVSVLKSDDAPDAEGHLAKDRPDSLRSAARSSEPGSLPQSGTGREDDFAGGSHFNSNQGLESGAMDAVEDAGDFNLPYQDDIFRIDDGASYDGATDATADELTFTSERATTTTSLSSLDLARRGSRPEQARGAAWLHTILSEGLNSASVDEGWRVIEMQLDEGQGTMTVRARRGEDGISIAVTFSDPQVRNLAAENLDRLQNLLQDQYETAVDFSLTSDDAGDTPPHYDGQYGARDANPDRIPRQEAALAVEHGHAARTVLAGARNEWIG